MSTHDCVSRINAMLAVNERGGNTQISVAISFNEPQRELIYVATAKRNPSDKRKALPMFASHCPFCGVELNKEATP